MLDSGSVVVPRDATRGETDATIDRHTDVTLTGPPLDSQIFNTSGNWVLADVAIDDFAVGLMGKPDCGETAG